MMSSSKNRWRSSFTSQNSVARRAELEHLEPREMLAGDVPTTEVASFIIRAVDLSGNEIQQVASGERFTIEVYGHDRRGEDGVTVEQVVGPNGNVIVSTLPWGLYSTFLNITYAHQGFDYDHSRSIQPGPEVDPTPGDLTIGVTADVSVDGMLANIGLTDLAGVNAALSGNLRPNAQLLFTVPLIAQQPNAPGQSYQITPHFNFMRMIHSEHYDTNGVPILFNDTAFANSSDDFTYMLKYPEFKNSNDVFFGSAELKVIPAGQIEGDFRIRVVKNPTPVNTQGEVVNLPTSATFIDEWETVYVEIYGKADPGYGVQNAVVDIHFNANQFKFHDVIASQQESSLKYSLTSVNSSTPGKVTVSLSNPLGNTGDDNFALLGRVRLMSIMELANDTSQGYIQPSTSLPISIGNVSPTLQVLGGDQSTIGTGSSAGFVTFDVWPVMYDTDDSGRVGISDFANLISHYGQVVNSPQTRRLDFNRDGVIGLQDFLLFIQNYGQQQGQVGTRTYVSGFPNSFLNGEPMMEGEPSMAGSGLLEGEPVFAAMTVMPTPGPETSTTSESITQGTSPSSSVQPSSNVQVVQYVDAGQTSGPSASDWMLQSEPQSGGADAYFESVEAPAALEVTNESDDLIHSVAVPPKADLTNEETDELFEDYEGIQGFDW